MVIAGCSLGFLVTSAIASERLWRARRPASCLPWIALAIAAWVGTLTLRTPTAWRALLTFVLADITLFAIAVLGVCRLLGAFDPAELPPPPGDEGGEDDDVDPWPVGPGGPPTARRPRGVSPRRSARGSARRGPSRSSSGRSAPARS